MVSRISFYLVYFSRLTSHCQLTLVPPFFSITLLSSSNDNTNSQPIAMIKTYEILTRLTSFKPFVFSFFERYVFNSKKYTYSVLLDISNFYFFYFLDLLVTFLVPAIYRRSGLSLPYGSDFYDVVIDDVSLLPYFGSYMHSFVFHIYLRFSCKQFFSLLQVV